MRTELYLGVGSNIDAERHLDFALGHLASRFTALECSRAYRNPAVGSDGSDFLNMVLRCRTALSPQAVKDVLRDVESAAARNRVGGPRSVWTLDIDLLLYGNLVDPTLRLPREDVLRHAFVLCPLAELAPQLRHPVTGETMAEAWRAHRSAGSPWTFGGRVCGHGLATVAGPIVKGEPAAHMEPSRI